MICHHWAGSQEGPDVWEVLERGWGVSSSMSCLLSSINLSLLSTIHTLSDTSQGHQVTKNQLNLRKEEYKYRKLSIVVLPWWL